MQVFGPKCYKILTKNIIILILKWKSEKKYFITFNHSSCRKITTYFLLTPKFHEYFKVTLRDSKA